MLRQGSWRRDVATSNNASASGSSGAANQHNITDDDSKSFTGSLGAVMLPNLAKPLLDWHSEMLSLALLPAAPPSSALPPLIDATELASLEAAGGWLFIENLVVVIDR